MALKMKAPSLAFLPLSFFIKVGEQPNEAVSILSAMEGPCSRLIHQSGVLLFLNQKYTPKIKTRFALLQEFCGSVTEPCFEPEILFKYLYSILQYLLTIRDTVIGSNSTETKGFSLGYSFNSIFISLLFYIYRLSILLSIFPLFHPVIKSFPF